MAWCAQNSIVTVAVLLCLAGGATAFTQFSETQLRPTGLRDPKTGYPIYLAREKDILGFKDRYELMAKWRLHKLFVTNYADAFKQQEYLAAQAAQKKLEAELTAQMEERARREAEAAAMAAAAEEAAKDKAREETETPAPRVDRSKIRELFHMGRRWIMGRQ